MHLILNLGTEDCNLYFSFFTFHFDFTGGKGVGKSSLVRRFLSGDFDEDHLGESQSDQMPFFYFFCAFR